MPTCYVEKITVMDEKGRSKSALDMERIKIVGGWLVVVAGFGDYTPSVTFVSDPDHRWSGNSLP